jgi:thiol-disulfide isomerase/thioredoxin
MAMSSASVIALAAIALAGACSQRRAETRPVAAAHAGCRGGQRDCLPDIDYIDTSGAAYPRDALLGKVVLVNFWATWCGPCEKEIPDLSKAYQKYKAHGVVFFGVLTDNPGNQQLLDFQSHHAMSYPVVRANPELLASFDNPDAYPTTYIYDRSGKQVYNRVGQVRDVELDQLLATLVAQN